MTKVGTRRAAGVAVLAILLLTALLPLAAFGDPSGNTNHPDYWENKYPNAVACYKHNGNSDHGKITDGGTAVRLNPFDPSWPGDRWEVLIVKGGQNGYKEYPLPSAGVDYHTPKNDNGKYADVSHWIVCKGQTPEPPAQVFLKMTKKWDGDDHGNATVSFSVNNDGPYAPGEEVNVTKYAGQTVTVTETVTGLADNCTFDSNLPKDVTVPKTFKDGKVIVVKARNNVDCRPPDEPDVFLEITKTWTGDDHGNATVGFFVDGAGPYQPGETVNVTQHAGQTVTITEAVSGLGADCTFDSNLPVDLAIPGQFQDGQLITVEAENEVDCKPPADPHISLLLTKGWDGDDIDMSGVDVDFSVAGTTVDLGQAVDVTAFAGGSVAVAEIVTGLPDTCSYTSDMPATVDVPGTFADGDVIRVDVTNTVDCPQPPPEEEKSISLNLLKVWEGDDIDMAGVDVDFTVGATTVDPGETVDVTDYAGQTVAITETVTGLPTGCTYQSDAPAEVAVPGNYVDGQVIEVTVTNTVDCEDPVQPESTVSTDPADTNPEPEVQGETVTTPPADPDDPQEDPENEGTLPFTGAGTDGMAAMALVALAGGLGLLLLTRGKPEAETEG